jgi:hypothetical protein
VSGHWDALVYTVEAIAAWATLVASFQIMNAWLSRATRHGLPPGSGLDQDLRNESLPQAIVIRTRQ